MDGYNLSCVLNAFNWEIEKKNIATHINAFVIEIHVHRIHSPILKKHSCIYFLRRN